MPTERSRPLKIAKRINHLIETATNAAWIHHPAQPSNKPAITDWARSTPFSDAGVTTASHTWDSCQKLTSFFWQMDYIRSLSTSLDYSGASPFMTPIQDLVLLFQSDWLTPATPFWLLKQIYLMFVALWTI